MRIPVHMPKLGYDMTEGRIESWLAEVGGEVGRGEPLAEIETDKIVIEMESLATGTLVEIVQPAGEDMIPVGEVIAYLDDGS
ncbi:MAG: biotin attachment protein [bacterium]|nr:biotin attachment protein [bacterium]